MMKRSPSSKGREKMSAATETTTIRVILVEDHADFRHLVSYWIDREPDLEVVAQAKSLEETRQNASSVGWDVAVLDLGLPDGSGTELIEELRESCPGCAVLVLSASLDPTNLVKVREAGPRRCWRRSRPRKRSSGQSGDSETADSSRVSGSYSQSLPTSS
jgi:CheY-like chemotaxis protein